MFRQPRCVIQPDASACGAAALTTVAHHFRVPVEFQRVRDLCGTDRRGATLLRLLRAAEDLGFSAIGVKGTSEALSQVPLPAIAHVKTEDGLGHFVVLYRVKKNTVLVADPARGLRVWSLEAFCREWSGHLLLLVPDHPPDLGKGADPARPWRRFVRLLGLHRSLLAEAGFCALLMTLLGVSTSYFLQHLVDSVLVHNEVRLLNALACGMGFVILFRTLFGVLRQYLLAYVGRRVDLTLIAGYARHVLGLPLRFFETRRVGDILAHVSDAAKVREALTGAVATAAVDGILVVFLLALLWCYDLPLALAATAFVPLLVLGVCAHQAAVRRHSRAAMERGAELYSHLWEEATGVETVKAFGLQRLRAEEGEARLVRFTQELFALQKLGISMDALGTAVTALAGLVVLWYGGTRVMEGALTIGRLLFFYSLLGFLLEPLQRLASVNMKLQDALVAVDRLFQILDLDAEPLREPHKVTFTGARDAVELRAVSFAYGYGPPVLDGVSLRIPAGKTVAIIGESGSGKSTLLKLLLGFYRPSGGQIVIDGVDLCDYDLESLRHRIGLVSQEPFIFNGTLRENIGLGRPGATLAEVAAAARAAGLEAFIRGLPERYETVIGERGVNLSGGQRQRLAIARAVLRQPDILIFDEATSNLDTATEREVRETLRTALAGKTVILVAHRLSTVRDADVIYVLQQGRVVEEGTHRELLSRQGRYESLWRFQTEGGEGRRHPPVCGSTAPERNGNGEAAPQGVSHA